MRQSSRLPASVSRLLQQFRDAYGVDAAVWVRTAEGWQPGATTGTAFPEGPLPDGAVPVPNGEGLEAAVVVAGGEEGVRHARFLAGVVSAALQHEEESRFFGREIGERYEEITLLYSISEILGSVISLEHAAGTILKEVAGTLAVQRAALWLHDPERRRLDLVAAYGSPGLTDPISVDDPTSITAAAFRERRPINLEPDDDLQQHPESLSVRSRGSLLSVPVSYSPPDGESRTIGVINLIGRGEEHRFLAGDQKLMMAIASQIGAAVENSRLVAASLQQERMVRELELAHDLQLKLLPPLDQFDGYAEVAARCVPAESVGGDFYHLFRLPGGRLGVMIGDVSSHGFGAALIMALTMSAVAIHASEGDSPAEVLRRTHRTLIDELETTEMYLTLFYGVIDPGLGRLTYANAGHAQAFHLLASGDSARLHATNPPLGIVDLDVYGEETTVWGHDGDLLLLFTDGLSDALDLGEIRGQRRVLDETMSHRHLPVTDILQRLYELPTAGNVPVDDRTAVLVRF
jgi:phosphoserine phosphatase RsbU/P